MKNAEDPVSSRARVLTVSTITWHVINKMFRSSNTWMFAVMVILAGGLECAFVLELTSLIC